MNADDVAQELFRLDFRAAMSQEYFQIMEWRWSMIDILAKIAVAVLAILGICAAAGKPKPIGKRGFNVAIASVFLLIVILILPAGKWAQDYRELALQWGTVRQQTTRSDTEFQKASDTEKASEAISAIQMRIGMIQEPAPWRGLVERCYWDQIERIYGEGIRSKEALTEHLSKAGIKEQAPPDIAPDAQASLSPAP